jgi:hypothetical protein
MRVVSSTPLKGGILQHTAYKRPKNSFKGVITELLQVLYSLQVLQDNSYIEEQSTRGGLPGWIGMSSFFIGLSLKYAPHTEHMLDLCT